MKNNNIRKDIRGNLILKDGRNKTVIITNPKSAAKYMKRTAIVVAPSETDKAIRKVKGFLKTTPGKVTMIAALAAIGAGAGAITFTQIKRATRLKNTANTLISQVIDEVELEGDETINEIVAKVTAYIATNAIYIDYPNRDKMALLNIIRRTIEKGWMMTVDDDCGCGCDDEDDEDDDDCEDETDEEPANVPQPPTPDEVKATTPQETEEVVVEAAKTVVGEMTSEIDKFNNRLNKTKEKQGNK